MVPPCRAEGDRIGDDDAGLASVQAEVAVEPVERAERAPGHGVVHAAGPEAALAVAAAVVHAAVGRLRLDLVDGLDRAGLRVEEAEPAVEGDHHAAVGAQHQGAGLLVHRHLPVRAGLGREPADRPALDVEPVEPPVDGAPDRALAEPVPAIDHARDLRH